MEKCSQCGKQARWTEIAESVWLSMCQPCWEQAADEDPEWAAEQRAASDFA